MSIDRWLLILVAAIILVIFLIFRRRGGPTKYPEIVYNILFDIKMNQALADTFQKRVKPKCFECSNWELNKTHIGFLNESVKKMLIETFDLVAEYNLQIKKARKEKTEIYKNIDLSHFKELLIKCRQELEDWMITNTGQKDLPTKYPGMSSLFFGNR